MLKPFAFGVFLTACTLSPAQTDAPHMTRTGHQVSTSLASNANFTTTTARLKAAIESRGLTLFNTIDHAAGAANADLQLAPNRLYIFGNPKAGTLLMQADPALGMHLPLKAHVYARDGDILIAVTDIRSVTDAHNVFDPAQVINKISETLSAIQAEAAGL